jgi:hypothetical protein
VAKKEVRGGGGADQGCHHDGGNHGGGTPDGGENITPVGNFTSRGAMEKIGIFLQQPTPDQKACK